LAKASKKHIEEKAGRRVVTEIVAASAFHLAEGYHQKYCSRETQGLQASYAFITRTTPGSRRRWPLRVSMATWAATEL